MSREIYNKRYHDDEWVDPRRRVKHVKPPPRTEMVSSNSKPIECFDERNNKFLQYFPSTACAAKLMHHSELRVRTACSSGVPFRGIIWRYASGQYDLYSNTKTIDDIKSLTYRYNRNVKGFITTPSESDSENSDDHIDMNSNSNSKERLKKNKTIRTNNPSGSKAVVCFFPIPVRIAEGISDADDENADFHSNMHCKWIMLKIFQSLSEVANTIHVSTATVSECCNGIRLYCGGLRWKYFSELPCNSTLDPCMDRLTNEDILNMKQLLFSSKLNQINPVHYIYNRQIGVSKDVSDPVRPTRNTTTVEYSPDRFIYLRNCMKVFVHLNEARILLNCITQAEEGTGYWTMESDKFKLFRNNTSNGNGMYHYSNICVPNLTPDAFQDTVHGSDRENFYAKYGIAYNRTHYRSIGANYQVENIPPHIPLPRVPYSGSKVIHISNFSTTDFLDQAKKYHYLCGAVVYWRSNSKSNKDGTNNTNPNPNPKTSKLVVVVANTYIHMYDSVANTSVNDDDCFISVYDGKTSYIANTDDLSWYIPEDQMLEAYKDFDYKIPDALNYVQFLSRDRLDRQQWKYIDVFSYIQSRSSVLKKANQSQAEHKEKIYSAMLQMPDKAVATAAADAGVPPKDPSTASVGDVWDTLLQIRNTLSHYKKEIDRKMEQKDPYALTPTFVPCPHQFSKNFHEFFEFHMFISVELLTIKTISNSNSNNSNGNGNENENESNNTTSTSTAVPPTNTISNSKDNDIDNQSDYITVIPKENSSTILSIYKMADHMVSMHNIVVTSTQIETILLGRK